MKIFSLIIVSVFIISNIVFAQDTSFTVSSSGNVGIGTSTPETKLEVNSGNNSINTRFITTTTFSGISFLNSLVSSDQVIVGAEGTDLRLGTNGTDRIAIKNDGKVGIGTSTPSEALSVSGNISLSGTVDGVDISQLKSDFDQRLSRYTKFGSLNYGSVNVTTTWTKLNTTSSTHQFTKLHSGSKIEVYVNARFKGGTFSGATGIFFKVRLNDTILPNFDNEGSINKTDTQEFQSLFAVFQTSATGSFTVSIWGQTNTGSSTGVMVDPGGWHGSIIVKETW